MIPDSARPIAKAIVGFIVPLTSVLVAVGILDVNLAAKINAEVIAVAAALGILTGGTVYATRNTR